MPEATSEVMDVANPDMGPILQAIPVTPADRTGRSIVRPVSSPAFNLLHTPHSLPRTDTVVRDGMCG